MSIKITSPCRCLLPGRQPVDNTRFMFESLRRKKVRATAETLTVESRSGRAMHTFSTPDPPRRHDYFRPHRTTFFHTSITVVTHHGLRTMIEQPGCVGRSLTGFKIEVTLATLSAALLKSSIHLEVFLTQTPVDAVYFTLSHFTHASHISLSSDDCAPVPTS